MADFIKLFYKLEPVSWVNISWHKVQELRLRYAWEPDEVPTHVGMTDSLAFLPFYCTSYSMQHFHDIIPGYVSLNYLLNYFATIYIPASTDESEHLWLQMTFLLLLCNAFHFSWTQICWHWMTEQAPTTSEFWNLCFKQLVGPFTQPCGPLSVACTCTFEMEMGILPRREAWAPLVSYKTVLVIYVTHLLMAGRELLTLCVLWHTVSHSAINQLIHNCAYIEK